MASDLTDAQHDWASSFIGLDTRSTTAGDKEDAGDSNGEPGPGAPPDPELKKVSVTIITKYGQQVKYWVQDLATDANNEAAIGQGNLIVDGEEHGPDESIALSCVETANGAVVCYRRASDPQGGGITQWSHAIISGGGSFEIPETPQSLSSSAGDPDSAQETNGAPRDPADDAAGGGEGV